MDDVAELVAEDLDFDVPRLVEILLEQDRAILERGLGFLLGGRHAAEERDVVAGDAHPTATTPRRGFNQHGVADEVRELQCFLFARQQAIAAGHGRDFRLLRKLFRFVLVADGVHKASIAALYAALAAEGAVTHFVGPRVGKFVAGDGGEIEANKSMENSPSVLFDALVLPDGDEAIKALARDGHTMEYVKDQFRHCKTILAFGAGRSLLEKAGILAGEKDPGILLVDVDDSENAAPKFIAAITAHRHASRDHDPPKI